MDSAQAIDFSKLTPIELMFGEDFEEAQQLAALCEEAELYLASFGWCQGVKKAYFGLGVSDLIGIFLFELMSSEDAQDKFLWVVAGDFPPACLATDNCPNPAIALREYIQKMKHWCSKALAEGKIDAEQERNLMRRITLLGSEVLSHYRDELN